MLRDSLKVQKKIMTLQRGESMDRLGDTYIQIRGNLESQINQNVYFHWIFTLVSTYSCVT